MSEQSRKKTPPLPPSPTPTHWPGAMAGSRAGGWRVLAVCGQSKMATGSQLTFYVSIFTFSVILSARAELLGKGKGGRVWGTLCPSGFGYYAFKLAAKAFPFLSFTRRPFAGRIMNMMGSLAASLGISAGQWGAILATKI